MQGAFTVSLVTVAIAACSGEKYIAEQLESLFCQTRVPDEILIGDDSADDATFRAIDAIRGRYRGELRYIRNPDRKGFSTNFENLYREARGNIVFLCDQDDIWLPEKIEKMSQFLESAPTCDLLFCDSACTDQFLHPLGFTMFERYGMTSNDIRRINRGKAFPLVVMRDIPVAGHDIALKKPLGYNIFPFKSEAATYHDQHLKYLTSYMERIRCLPEALTLYRRHERNVSKLFDKRKTIQKYDPRDGLTHAKKLHEFTRRMCALRDFLQSRLGEHYGDIPENSRYLSDLIRFFDKRRKALSSPPYLRPFCFSSTDFFRYFQYCSGMKTMLHDFICHQIHESDPDYDS